MFNEQGVFKPADTSQVFSYPQKSFYKFAKFSCSEILVSISKIHNQTLSTLQQASNELTARLKDSPNVAGLVNGPGIPFYLPPSSILDLGQRLEGEFLPNLASAFTSTFPDSHFKAIVQDKQQLTGRLNPAEHSGYQRLINLNANSAIFGHYYPFAYNQYAVSSARESFQSIPHNDLDNICLSGPLEICSAVSTCPGLLIHSDSYSPILVMSGVTHTDKRLIGCLKSYGPHLEFWILSNLLSPGVEQVSEQWTSGITHYAVLPTSATI